MSYSNIPTRSSSDPNAASDINQLMANTEAMLDGTKRFSDFNASAGAFVNTVSANTVDATTGLFDNLTVASGNITSLTVGTLGLSSIDVADAHFTTLQAGTFTSTSANINGATISTLGFNYAEGTEIRTTDINVTGTATNQKLNVTSLISFFTATGSGVVWDDIVFPAVSLGKGTDPPDMVEIGSSGIYAPGFDGTATEESLYSSPEMLHDYAEGTDISPHIHWCPSTNATGDVKWQLTYSWVNGASQISGTTISKVASVTGGTGTHIFTTFPDITGSGKTIGSLIAMRIFRQPGTASDTYGDDAILLDFGVHYKVNSLGSRTTQTK